MEPIEIKNFELGIGESEFEGNGLVMNADLTYKKGVVRIREELTNESVTKVAAQVRWIVPNEARVNELWAVDQSENVYRGTTNITGTEAWSTAFTFTGDGGGTGLRVWKDYLFITGTAELHVYGPLSGSPVLDQSTQWPTAIVADDTWHPMLVGQDDVLYGGSGRNVFSLSEVSAQNFDPTNTATYTFASAALDLPEDYRIRCISELGRNLLLGTWKGTNIQDHKIADIFPWDRTSDDFNLPIRISENGIHAMLNISNLLYFFAGTEGKLFTTDGSSVQQLSKIPEQIVSLDSGAFIDMFPGAVIHHNGKILFGLSAGGNTNTAHVWSYNLKTGALSVENSVSSGTALANRTTALLSTGALDYWAAHRNDDGLDRIDHIQTASVSSRYTGYACVLTSPYLQVGRDMKPGVISKYEIIFARPLIANQGFRISYRTDTSATFTVVETKEFADIGGAQSYTGNLQTEVKQGIQFRIQLTTGSGASTSPEFVKLVIS